MELSTNHNSTLQFVLRLTSERHEKVATLSPPPYDLSLPSSGERERGGDDIPAMVSIPRLPLMRAPSSSSPDIPSLIITQEKRRREGGKVPQKPQVISPPLPDNFESEQVPRVSLSICRPGGEHVGRSPQ